MNVKRYSVGYKDSASGRYAAMLDKQDGGYVSYEDYAALEQKLAESQREFRAADATIENLQMQVEKLAAENAGLKRVPATDSETMLLALDAFNTHGYTRPDVGLQQAINVVMQRRETPATDAFLAEVRAQGVEMCSSEIQKQIWDEREGDGIAAAIDAMEIYASQLRKGDHS